MRREGSGCAARRAADGELGAGRDAGSRADEISDKAVLRWITSTLVFHALMTRLSLLLGPRLLLGTGRARATSLLIDAYARRSWAMVCLTDSNELRARYSGAAS